MLGKHAQRFYLLGNNVAILKSLLAYYRLEHPKKSALPEVRELLPAVLLQLSKQCKMLHLRFSLRALARLREELLKDQPNAYNIETALEELDKFIVDELRERVLYFVRPDRAAHYANFRRGWEGALNKFDIAADVEEAEKCFALDRFPASVYHAMRIAEAGVLALGARFPNISAAILEKPWGTIVSALDAEVKAMPRRTGPEKDQQAQFAAVVDALFHVNLAWRIPASHAARKPLSTYDPEQAGEVLSRTKALMRHLAAII